ncbi:MAG: RES family NAD+ phosphorylase [Bacillati bacterium]
MKLYRIFPYDPNAAEDHPGGALYLPHGGENRFDNPSLYRTLYLALQPEAAVMERFGTLTTWRPVTFTQRLSSIDHPVQLALGTYQSEATIADLCQVKTLVGCDVQQATDVVTRNRHRTQELATAIFTKNRFHGLAWWSYYNPDWTNVALWAPITDRDPGIGHNCTLIGKPEPLFLDHPLVADIATLMARRRIHSNR